jgi:MFS family permease
MQKASYIAATVIGTAYSFTDASMTTVLAGYLAGLGFTKLELSFTLSLFSLALIFASFELGYLSDVVGRHKVMLLGLICSIISALIYIFKPTIITAPIAQVLGAIGFAAVVWVAVAKIGDSIIEKRGALTGISQSIRRIGNVSAPIVAGLLADRFFVTAPIILNLIILVILIPVLYIESRGDGHNINREQKNTINRWERLRWFLRNPKLRALAIIGPTVNAALPIITLILPLFVLQKLGLGYIYVGYLISAWIVSKLFQWLLGHIADRISWERGIVIGTLVTGAGLIAIAFTQNYWLILVLILIAGTSDALWDISAVTLLSHIGAKENRTGEAIGTYFTFAKIGSFASFVASGFVITLFNPQLYFAIIGSLIIAATAIGFKGLMAKEAHI